MRPLSITKAGPRVTQMSRVEPTWDYDITGKICPMFDTTSGNEWPMYSYNGPSMTVWNTIASVLHARGWNDDRIKAWLQSKAARWAMDMDLGDALREAAIRYAATIEE